MWLRSESSLPYTAEHKLMSRRATPRHVASLDVASGLATHASRAAVEEMKKDGKLQLDEIVYNSLLDGCGRKQKVGRAMQAPPAAPFAGRVQKAVSEEGA